MAIEAIERHEALMRVYTNSTRTESRASISSSNHDSSSSRTAHASNATVSQHDLDVIRAHHQFLRDADADAVRGAHDWQVRMSVRYYRRLFREYALADLSQYRDGKVGLRWRTEREVVTGKGQFVCGNKRCDARVGLRSYELLFAYREQHETKRCLVKVRACEACAGKLFYRKLRALRRQQREKHKTEEEGETAAVAAQRDAASASVRRSPTDSRSQQTLATTTATMTAKDKRAHRVSGDRATHETERDGRRTKRQRRTRSAAPTGGSSASESDSEQDADERERRSSVHDLCAAINARERRDVRDSSSGDPTQQRRGFFEDRTGSDHSLTSDREQTDDDDALFRDLLV